MTETSINDALAVHASQAIGWTLGSLDLAAFMRELHAWAGIFSAAYEIGVDTPAITLEKLPRRRLGHYRRGRNGFRLHHEIAINLRHLGDSKAEVLGTLLHELLHAWQDVHGKPGKRNYHNKEFRARALSLGLVVDTRGHQHVVPGPFTELLAAHGVELTGEPLCPAARTVRSAASRMRKHTCDCTTVYCATTLRATCDACGRWFSWVG